MSNSPKPDTNLKLQQCIRDGTARRMSGHGIMKVYECRKPGSGCPGLVSPGVGVCRLSPAYLNPLVEGPAGPVEPGAGGKETSSGNSGFASPGKNMPREEFERAKRIAFGMETVGEGAASELAVQNAKLLLMMVAEGVFTVEGG